MTRSCPPTTATSSPNEEFSDTVAVLSLTRDPRIVWEYGHPDVQGSSPGYLALPDDAYLLADGDVQVADIINCRVLWLNRRKRIIRSIGTAGDLLARSAAGAPGTKR